MRIIIDAHKKPTERELHAFAEEERPVYTDLFCSYLIDTLWSLRNSYSHCAIALWRLARDCRPRGHTARTVSANGVIRVSTPIPSLRGEVE